MAESAVPSHFDDLAELRRNVDDPFVRWCLPRAEFHGAWRLDAALLVVFERHRRRNVPGPWALLLGDGSSTQLTWDLVPELLGTRPGSMTVSSALAGGMPPQWQLLPARAWDVMVTRRRVDDVDHRSVERVDDATAIGSLLDRGNPGAHARPGDPDVVGWWGEPGSRGLACVGALTSTDWGGAHLRAITTEPSARGRGYGTRVSAALTNEGLATLSDEVTLGVYSDNIGAIGLYERLGYRRAHRFVSFA